MNSKTKMMMGLVVSLGAVAMGTGTARGAALIDFNLGLAAGGGTITYAGGTAPLVGTNIEVGALHGVGTDLHNGAVLPLTGACGGFACLNFTTGTGNGSSFSAGGSFTITGDVPGIPGIDTGGPFNLLTGSGLSATVSNTGVLNFFVQGSDTKNPTLVSYFLLNPPASWGFSGTIEGPFTTGTGGSFSVTPDSLDINNIATPEPMSVFLLGTAMVGIATVIRRRKKNQVIL